MGACNGAFMADFYDELASDYHLIFADWEESITRQGRLFGDLIRARWPGHRSVLDVSCGIGTQAIALAQNGFWVKGSDISAGALERARSEAAKRGLVIEFSICDMRHAFECHGTGHDVVLSADNSIAHLLDDTEIQRALESMFACLKPGGGCLITMRDYDREPRGKNLVKPYGARVLDGKRFLAVQVWDFAGDLYDLTFYVIEEELATGVVNTRALRSRCYAIGTERVLALMQQAGFEDVQRLDEVFYQPVLVGTRSV
jgi:SAM-dependent methyltransferase